MSRSRSKRSGSAQRSGSRLAAPIISITRAPAGIFSPPSSTSAVVTRGSPWTGGSKRSASSTASGTRSGSARRRSSSLGWASSASTALPSRFVVVSFPATSRSRQKASSSSGESRPSDVSACTSWLIRSSDGSLRRRSISASKYALNSRTASMIGASATPRRAWPTNASDQRLKSAWRARSTPSSSAITVTGSGIVRSRTRSVGPPRAISSSTRRWVISRMRPSSLPISRGVKPRFRMPR